MFDFLNRRDVYSHTHTSTPYMSKDKKRVLEEKNTIVVSHEKVSLFKKVKRLFKR